MKNGNLNFKLLFLIIYLSNFPLLFLDLYFAYPTSVNLKNDNFLVIYQDGICVCNSKFKKIVKTIYTFNESEKITKNNLYNITIAQFNDGFIVSFIVDSLYFFDKFGELKKKEINSQLQTYIYL